VSVFTSFNTEHKEDLGICLANGECFLFGQFVSAFNADRMEDGGFALQIVGVFSLIICERFYFLQH
jgi:hypothetical protein